MANPAVLQYKSNEGTNPPATQINGTTTAYTSGTTSGTARVTFYTLSDYAGVHNDMACSDSQGNSYTGLDQQNTSASGGAASLKSFVALNGGSGACTVTTKLSTIGDVEDFQSAFIAEISNVISTGLIGHSGNTQNGLAVGTNNLVSGNISVSVSQVPCILVAMAFNTSSNGSHPCPTVGTGMTNLANCWAFQTGPNLACVAYRVITTAGTYQAVFNQASSATEDCACVAMILQGTGGSGNPGAQFVGTSQSTASGAGSLSGAKLLSGAIASTMRGVGSLMTSTPTGLNLGASAASHAASAVTNAATVGVTTNTGSGFFVGAIGKGAPTAVSDSFGNAYTLIQSQSYQGGLATADLWYCANGQGGANHSVSVTQTNAADISVYFLEVTSARHAGVVLDTSTGTNDTSSPFTSLPISTSVGQEMVLAFFGGYSASNPATLTAVGGNLTLQATETNGGTGTEAVGGFAAYATSSALTGYTASFTQAGNTLGGAVFVASVYAATTSPLTGIAASTASGFGALSTAARFAGIGRSTASGTGTLLTSGSVLLTAPAYTGIGGIYDPYFWVGTPPTIGTTVYYDPTYIIIQPDGEIVSTANNINAQVYFFTPGGLLSQGLIQLTSGFAAYSYGIASASGYLTTFVGGLGTTAAAAMSGSANLTTGIALAGQVAAVASASATLAAAIQLTGVAAAETLGGGNLSQVAQLAGVAASSVSGAGAIALKQILAGVASAHATGSGQLTHGAMLVAAAESVVRSIAALTTSIRILGKGSATVSGRGALTTSSKFLGSGSSVTQGRGSLTTGIKFRGVGAATESALGSIRTGKGGLKGTAAAVSRGTAALRAPVGFFGQAAAKASAAVSLSNQILFAGVAASTVTGDPELNNLTTKQSPTGLYIGDPHFMANDAYAFLPQSLILHPTDERVITFDFTYDLAVGESLAGVAHVQVTCTAGVDITPTNLLNGQPSFNTAMTQVLQPVTGIPVVLGCDYYVAMTSPTTNPQKVLTRYALVQVRE